LTNCRPSIGENGATGGQKIVTRFANLGKTKPI
jgi:hypothetical protein